MEFLMAASQENVTNEQLLQPLKGVAKYSIWLNPISATKGTIERTTIEKILMRNGGRCAEDIYFEVITKAMKEASDFFKKFGLYDDSVKKKYKRCEQLIKTLIVSVEFAHIIERFSAKQFQDLIQLSVKNAYLDLLEALISAKRLNHQKKALVINLMENMSHGELSYLWPQSRLTMRGALSLSSKTSIYACLFKHCPEAFDEKSLSEITRLIGAIVDNIEKIDCEMPKVIEQLSNLTRLNDIILQIYATDSSMPDKIPGDDVLKCLSSENAFCEKKLPSILKAIDQQDSVHAKTYELSVNAFTTSLKTLQENQFNTTDMVKIPTD
jgi:transcription termination factor NusB